MIDEKNKKKHWFNHAACPTTGYCIASMVWDIFPASFQQRLHCLPTFVPTSLLSLYRNHLHVLQQAMDAWSVRDILCWVIAKLFSEGPLDYLQLALARCSVLHCIIYFYECHALAGYRLHGWKWRKKGGKESVVISRLHPKKKDIKGICPVPCFYLVRWT